jgi:hypothetical protein
MEAAVSAISDFFVRFMHLPAVAQFWVVVLSLFAVYMIVHGAIILRRGIRMIRRAGKRHDERGVAPRLSLYGIRERAQNSTRWVNEMVRAIRRGLMGRRGDGLENWITTCALLLILVTASEAGAELAVQGWLDIYEGRTKLPADVGKIVVAASYVLGLADGAIAFKVMSCPTDYVPDGGALAGQTARVIGKSRGHPALSVTAAVLIWNDLSRVSFRVRCRAG